MDHLNEHLATAASGHKYDTVIKAAIAVGKKTLNRYYDRTDHSELYRIAMCTCFLNIFHASSLANLSFAPFSLTPVPQVLLLQSRWMNARVDCNSEENYSGRI
jgi:hypothetical protein